MVDVFEKNTPTLQSLNPSREHACFLPEELAEWMQSADTLQRFDQLILIGAPHDNAWVHAFLPQDAARRIVAEIPYPLLAAWMTEPKRDTLKDVVRKLLP
jgi:hypothetical protein